LPVSELGKWIEARTDGKYTIVKKEQTTDVAAIKIVAEHLNNNT